MEFEDAAGMLRPSSTEAVEAYHALVAAHHAQSLRTGDLPREGDSWAQRAGRFRPGGFEADEMDVLREFATPEQTWLDVGAGGGRFAVPLSRLIKRVVAVEPSPAMRTVLRAAIEEHGITNLSVVESRWPPEPSVDVPEADVSLVANVLYGNEELDAFIEALERHTWSRCVVVAADPSPNTPHPGIWEAMWGEARRSLPGARELIATLWAMGRAPEVRVLPSTPAQPSTPDEAAEEFAWLYRVAPGSPDVARLRAAFVERYGQPDGSVLLPPRRQCGTVISWRPR